ncbi:MAG: hypothetical protein IPL27_07715 [Lewinellaceae bacterium]|nr:hypothetical protein [Lewinellaceae bacterium]
MDSDNDGDTDITDDACGDLPNINMVKNFVSAVPTGNGTFNVTYTIVVSNPGTVAGTYGLKDTPLFDNDVTINSGTYSGQASGSMNISGTTTLATNATIAAGATHTYTVTFNVSLNLAPGSPAVATTFTLLCSAGQWPWQRPGSRFVQPFDFGCKR